MSTESDSDTNLRNEAFLLFGRLIAHSDPSRIEAWAELGLTITQLRVLFVLRREDGLAAGALADRLEVTPSTVTRIMDRLVQNRLVRREIDEDDRRLVRHCLTDSGLGTIEEMERAFRVRMDGVLSQLTDGQIERLVFALRDLFAAFEAIEAGEGHRVAVT